MTTTPAENAEDLRAIKDPAERALAVQAYVDRTNTKLREATEIRRQAIAELLEIDDRRDWNRPGEIAKACGVSVSTVKAVRATL